MSRVVLEAILVAREDDRLLHIRPHASPSMQVFWDEDLHPNEAVIDAVAELGGVPLMVHSTSWRTVDTQLVLSFVVVLESGAGIPTGTVAVAVERAELARGHAMGPPAEVETAHVVEHGLRHLAWLREDDVAIGEALRDWGPALAGYAGAAEPFRSLG